jgi:DHA1 family tetracycline resistance protein-like MFS transporter
MKNNILIIIFMTIFIDMLGIGILIPVFPLLINPNSIYKITPDTWNMSSSFIMSGWLLAIYPFTQFLFSPILGQLSDRFGRKKILIFSILGTGISYILFAIGIYIKSIWLIFFSRALDGITGANISVAQASIADISEEKNRAKNFGVVGIALGLGFILGPFLGGILSDNSLCKYFDAATPFWIATALSIINIILIQFFLPETIQIYSNRRINLISSIDNIKKVFLNKEITNGVITSFLFSIGFNSYTTFWGIILSYYYKFSQSETGSFFGYMGIAIVLAQGLVVRKLSGKFLEENVLKLSILSTAISILAYYFVSVEYQLLLYIIIPFLAISVSLTRSFMGSYLSKLVPNNMQGEIMGINSSAMALSQVFPAILAGYIAIHHVKSVILLGAFLTFIGWIYFIKNLGSK